MSRVTLREVQPADLPFFFEHQRDPVAVRMAAFTAADPDDRAAFEPIGHAFRPTRAISIGRLSLTGKWSGACRAM